MKKCNKCEETKPLTDFVKRNNRPNGYQAYCKKCHNKKERENHCPIKMRNYDLKKTYGIDIYEYNLMFENQKGCCKICNKHISELNSKHKKNLCVDHNHKTGKVRGLLCDKCNRGLGLFCDNENMLKKAMEYLIKNN